MHSLLLASAIAPLLATAAMAQGADAIGASFGTARLDGELHGIGPTYRAHFDGRGMHFLPALGPTAPADATLHFALASVRRGEQVVFARGEAQLAPAIDENSDNLVRYRHGRDLIEVYDVRHDGVEQRFVFAERPAGQGDLVVSGNITTGLPLASADASNGLRYEIAGIGGVTIGAVTGIDALGNRVAGTIRALDARGERIEYTLPARFVDRAAYPLTLDPLFGASFQIDAASTGPPDVAFDATYQRYCVVWNVGLNAGNTDVRGRLVSATGALVASPILVDTEGSLSRRPAVVDIHATDRFLVGWVHLEPIIAGVSYSAELNVRAIAPASAVQSAAVRIAGGSSITSSASVTDFDLGGDSRTPLLTTPDRAVVAFRLTSSMLGVTQQYLFAGRIQVPGSGDPVLVGGTPGLSLLTMSGYPSKITVSSHGGSAGRWLVLWTNTATGGAPFTSVNGHVVQDSTSMLCGSSFQVATGADLDNPAAATADGTSFALAWQDTGAGRIKIRPGTWLGSCTSGLGMAIGATLDPIQGSGTTSFPALDFAQNKYVLAYRRKLLLFQPNVYAKSLDPTTCAICGSEWQVQASSSAQNTPAIVANWSGSATQQDGALVVWQSLNEVRAVRYDATGSGAVAGLGGSCGTAGGNIVGYQGSPVLGSLDFALTLDAPTAPVLALVIGLSPLQLPCGPCTLVPALDIVMVGGGPHSVPLPCNLAWLGGQLWTQWLLFAPGGCAVLPDIALSSAQRFTIGE